MSGHTDYWRECISNAADDCGLVLDCKQLETMAGAVKSGHENYGLAFFAPSGTDHLRGEIARLETELQKERNKATCPECKGSGRLVYSDGIRSSDSQCPACHGEGKR